MRPVAHSDGAGLAKELGARAYVECSALTQVGLKRVFYQALIAHWEPAPEPERKRARCQLL